VTHTKSEEWVDFRRIAALAHQMMRLGDAGWWSDTAFAPEQEEVMRSIAPVGGWTANFMAAGKDCPESPAAYLVGMVATYFDW
jgi:hypothetical protein